MIFSLFQIKIYYRIKYVFYFLGLAIFWGNFTFAINYGNLLITQKHYEVFKLESALSDLAKHPYKKIVFSGPHIRTPVVVEKAKEYLLMDELNATQIANLLGYESIHYFSRQFKNITGFSPTEYRNSLT